MSSARAYPSDIEACHKLLRDLDATLVERDATLVTKDATILDRDALIAERDRIISAHAALVEQQNRQLEGERPPPPYASRSDFRLGDASQRLAAARRLARFVILASARASRSSTRYWRMASGCDCFHTSGRIAA